MCTLRLLHRIWAKFSSFLFAPLQNRRPVLLLLCTFTATFFKLLHNSILQAILFFAAMHERVGLGKKKKKRPLNVPQLCVMMERSPGTRGSGATGDVSGNNVECHKAAVNLQFSVPLTLTREMRETPE